MMKRLPILLLALGALVLASGCAMEPAYRYNVNAGGGYYSGQSPYGNADTVVYGSGYADPWGWGGYYGPGWGYYGPGWGYGGVGIGFGATYVISGHHHRRHYRPHRSWNHGQQHHRGGSQHQGHQRHQGHRHHRGSRR